MNKELKKIYEEDQQDRLKSDVDFDFISKRDEERRKKVQIIIKEKSLKTEEDFYHAAMIFHHGSDDSYIKKAQSLAKKSMELGYEKARWLYAATIDRLLMRQGKKQKFGTQFTQKTSEAKWKLYPVDSETTNEERALYNVPPLEETKKKIKGMN